jgi:hypothetical protein
VKCPFGISSCTTIAKVAVGFWANFTANGSISDATRCPPNYCGCRNIPMYSDPSCQLFPLFAAEYQPEEALCSGNRTGVLCGGCKPNFTQSLNGYSCISNEECSQNVAWTWAVTIIGYIIFSIYIVYSSTQVPLYRSPAPLVQKHHSHRCPLGLHESHNSNRSVPFVPKRAWASTWAHTLSLLRNSVGQQLC